MVVLSSPILLFIFAFTVSPYPLGITLDMYGWIDT